MERYDEAVKSGKALIHFTGETPNVLIIPKQKFDRLRHNVATRGDVFGAPAREGVVAGVNFSDKTGFANSRVGSAEVRFAPGKGSPLRALMDGTRKLG